jgi:1-acyl-sn-glycerol-3-phosphate acyltransferase
MARERRGPERRAYRAVRRLCALLLGLFYRRLEVRGLEHLPRRGPVVVTANHHNALVDAMLPLATVPRPLTFLAKAPLFRHPLIAPFLTLVRAIPVHRPQDPGADMARNAEMFAVAVQRLAEGEAVLIFPEGASHAEPALMPLRTGAARLIVAAGEAGLGAVPLIPVGLVFDEPGSFRTGSGLVAVGPPVEVGDLLPEAGGLAAAAGLAADAGRAERAVREITARLAAALGALIVEAGDRETLRLVAVVERIWHAADRSAAARDLAASAEWRRRVVRAHRYLLERDPERVAALRLRVERYAKALELAGVREGAALPAPGAVLRYALREGLALLGGAPAALLGIAQHGAPYWLTRRAVGLLRPEPDEAATYKITAGLVLYPLCWALETALVTRLLGVWWAVGFALALVPSAFFALSWRERLDRVAAEARGYARLLADRDLPGELARRRAAILAELQALVQLVPPAVLEGHPGEQGPP